MTAQFYGESNIGLSRGENQDRWFASDELGLFIVADGIAGAPQGGTAAEIVVQVLPALLRPVLESVSLQIEIPPKESSRGTRCKLSDVRARCSLDHRVEMRDSSDIGDWLREQLHKSLITLSEQLRTNSQITSGLSGMGSTAVVLIHLRDFAVCGHLGDSRLYQLRGANLQLLTKDHSLTQLLQDSGDLAAADATTHPSRGQLTRFVGMPAPVLPTVQSVTAEPGDRFLLCSDGVSGAVTFEELAAILQSEDEPREAVDRLIAAANAAGGKDNATALVVDLVELAGVNGTARDASSAGSPTTAELKTAPDSSHTTGAHLTAAPGAIE